MSKPRLIAFYLPQFHSIPENDEWWGVGFTEWVNVKKAKPLFKGHNQPRIPLAHNYYDLMEPETFSWQVNLAKSYNVDGFCFYHYWFNGKLLLEKPAEDYLLRTELDRIFCFSWANEPWARTWDGQNTNVLMPQAYTDEKDIVDHFNYLLPFFKDQRYLKIDDKPVFLLYRANSITYINEMITKWNSLAVANGLKGIYFVETLTSYSTAKYSESTDAIVYMEPMYVLSQRNLFQRIQHAVRSPFFRNKRINYSFLWKKVLEKEMCSAVEWSGAFIDWDNSPRKAKKNLVLSGTSVAVFKEYFKLIYRRTIDNKCPFIFINAWNEWAEGTYLEPDTNNHYDFLESIKNTTQIQVHE